MTKKYHYWASIFYLLIFTGSLDAQYCGTAALDHRPRQAEVIQSREGKIQRWVDAHPESVESGNVLVIPVVIHVVYRLEEQNISDQGVVAQLESLNRDFRMTNNNLGKTPMFFQSLAADVEVEFCLAHRDPDGLSSTGIVRTKTDVEQIGLTTRFYKKEQGGSTLWPSEDYINIYVCETDGNLLGYATFPDSQEEFDGIMIHSDYFGVYGDGQGTPPYNKGRTLTHEMGHYLGLEHLWGADHSPCNEDDFVEDTPKQELPSYGCPDYPLRDICSPDNRGVMFMNFMDYADDTCLTMFTQGQKQRIWAQLNLYRSGLVHSKKCLTSASTSTHITTPKIYWSYPTSEICIDIENPTATPWIAEIWNAQGLRLTTIDLDEQPCHNWHPPFPSIYFLVIKNQQNILHSTIFVAH